MLKVMHPGPNSRVKANLKIGEVARLAGVRVDTVRFYERQGLLPAGQRTRGGYRQFTEASVERIAFIKQAQALGFSLEEVGQILRAIDAGGVDYARGRTRLLAVAARIDAKIAELRAVRRKLNAMLKRFEAGHCEDMERTAQNIRRR